MPQGDSASVGRVVMARNFAYSGTFLPALALAFIVGFLQLAQGCARPAACERNSDCNNGYCLEGECKRDCIDAERDCPEGWVCNLNAQCVPLHEGAGGQGGGGSDAGDSDAGDGGAGGLGGADPGDAGEDASIDPGLDAGDDGSIDDDAGGNGGSGGRGGAGGRGGSGGSDDEDGGLEDDGGAGGAGGAGGEEDGGVEPTKPLGLLDLCRADEDCEGSFICRPMYVNGPKRCTKSCTAFAQCMTGTRCETVGEERYCAQSDIGKACGTSDDCNSRCMTQRGYCTSECQTGADCPNGYGCTGVGTPSVRMCVKTSIYCGDNANVCAGGANACEHDDIPISSCTIPCSSASDCPQRASALGSKWTCIKYPNWTSGYCMRPNDVYGPIEGGAHADYLCAPGTTMIVNACADGLNTNIDEWYTPNPPYVNCNAGTTTPGVAGDSCIDSCRYQGACAFGFSCAAISSIGNQRLGLCLPTGQGEIGEPCTKHRDCTFGYCNLDTSQCTRDCSADGVCPSGSTCTATGAFIEGIAFKRCE